MHKRIRRVNESAGSTIVHELKRGFHQRINIPNATDGRNATNAADATTAFYVLFVASAAFIA